MIFAVIPNSTKRWSQIPEVCLSALCFDLEEFGSLQFLLYDQCSELEIGGMNEQEAELKLQQISELRRNVLADDRDAALDLLKVLVDKERSTIHKAHWDFFLQSHRGTLSCPCGVFSHAVSLVKGRPVMDTTNICPSEEYATLLKEFIEKVQLNSEVYKGMLNNTDQDCFYKAHKSLLKFAKLLAEWYHSQTETAQVLISTIASVQDEVECSAFCSATQFPVFWNSLQEVCIGIVPAPQNIVAALRSKYRKLTVRAVFGFGGIEISKETREMWQLKKAKMKGWLGQTNNTFADLKEAVVKKYKKMRKRICVMN